MAQSDYYETLGVRRDADDAAIKSAFRKQAMRYHPDRNAGDSAAEQRFKEINEAYDVLKDAEKRAAYDRYGHDAFRNGMGGRSAGFEGFSSFSDIFEDIFGNSRGRRGGRNGERPGADLRFNMAISLTQAFNGWQTEIRVPGSENCKDCRGTGAEGGSQPVICSACHGSGVLRAQQGLFTIERTCAACGGGGRVIEKPCLTCRGSGRVKKEKTLSVDIPAGVDNGTRIRLSGEGEPGARGAPPGDLYIFLTIEDHPMFQRDGADIHCAVPLSMTAAALGGPIDVPTIEGTRSRINIKPGTQTGTQYRLRGKGMSKLRSTVRGDHYVTVAVETPMNLTRQQKELLEEFSKCQDKTTSPESNNFFDRVRNLFSDRRD